jgi:hypothetical protein
VSPPPRPASRAEPASRAAAAEPLADRFLIAALRQGLAAEADPTKASGMRASMKSEMPCYGVQAPLLRRVCRQVFAEVLRYVHAHQDTLSPLSRREALRNVSPETEGETRSG